MFSPISLSPSYIQILVPTQLTGHWAWNAEAEGIYHSYQLESWASQDYLLWFKMRRLNWLSYDVPSCSRRLILLGCLQCWCQNVALMTVFGAGEDHCFSLHPHAFPKVGQGQGQRHLSSSHSQKGAHADVSNSVILIGPYDGGCRVPLSWILSLESGCSTELKW